MGFGGKTPKPGEPTHKNTQHRHKYWSKTENRWVESNCNCATGKFHVTPKS